MYCFEYVLIVGENAVSENFWVVAYFYSAEFSSIDYSIGAANGVVME